MQRQPKDELEPVGLEEARRASAKAVLASALLDSPYAAEEGKKGPRPCEKCGKLQEPIHLPDLDLSIHRPPICEACRIAETARKEAAAVERRKATIEQDLKRAGLPESLLTCDFRKLGGHAIQWSTKALLVVQACTQYAQKAEGGIMLVGKTGRGKSHLAAAILRSCLLSGGKGRWESCVELVAKLRAVYKSRDPDDPASEMEVLEGLGRGMIVLDDLGADRFSPMVKSALTLIVDRCERNRQPLVVTTNLTIDAIAKLDERIASRLGGICGNGERILDLDGPDHRMKKNR